MKKFLLALLAVVALGSGSFAAQADVKDLVGGLISGLVGEKQLTEMDIAGVYKYKEPAVTFKSDNFLQKAGGAAMAVPIVNKLTPYYEKAGITKLEMTLNADKTFQFNMGKMKLQGTYERDSTQTDANEFIFNFKAFGKVKIGSIDADVQKTSSGLVMTFDVSKLMTLMNTVAKISGMSTLKAASALLNSYDGLNAGFALTKTADVEGATTEKKSWWGSKSDTSSTPATGTTDAPADTTSTSTGKGVLGGLIDAIKRK